MTKNFKSILLLVVALMLTLTLTGCGFDSKAKQIADDFKNGETMSLKDIQDKMGDPTVEAMADIVKSGTVIWIEGCGSLEDAKEKWDEGKEMSALVVVVAANNVISVTFIEKATENDVKA